MANKAEAVKYSARQLTRDAGVTKPSQKRIPMDIHRWGSTKATSMPTDKKMDLLADELAGLLSSTNTSSPPCDNNTQPKPEDASPRMVRVLPKPASEQHRIVSARSVPLSPPTGPRRRPNYIDADANPGTITSTKGTQDGDLGMMFARDDDLIIE